MAEQTTKLKHKRQRRMTKRQQQQQRQRKRKLWQTHKILRTLVTSCCCCCLFARAELETGPRESKLKPKFVSRHRKKKPVNLLLLLLVVRSTCATCCQLCSVLLSVPLSALPICIYASRRRISHAFCA